MENDYNSQENENPKTVDVLPLKKIKRMLVFLADFFITFVACFLLYNLATMPLGKVMTGYDKKNATYETEVENSHNILYKNNIVKISPDYTENDIDLNIEYTFDCWLSYYTLNEEISPDTRYPEYGHKIENEVINHFYVDIRSNGAAYIDLFKSYNESLEYFSVDGGVYLLKDNVKEAVSAYFYPGDKMGKTGQNFYKKLKSDYFLPLLSNVFSDIEQNDLTFNGLSYVNSTRTIASIKQYHDNLLIITSITAYVLSWAGYYLIFPLVNKKHRTLAMLLMGVERINLTQLYICKKREALLFAIYSLFINTLMVFFMPVTYVAFNYLFSLGWLLYISAVSLALMIASFIVTLCSSFNRSISDIFSKTVLITTADLDNIYRAKGYNI